MEYTTWIENTALSTWLRDSISLLAFPTVLIVHAIGMGLLAGTNAVVDLRILGVARQVPVSLFERYFPVMWFGLAINVVSGICFFTAAPDQYLFNPSFQLKVLSMSLAGLNVLLFYTTMFRKIKALGPGEQAPLPTRIMGGVSLVSWMGVITFGRLLTFFRPRSIGVRGVSRVSGDRILRRSSVHSRAMVVRAVL